MQGHAHASGEPALNAGNAGVLTRRAHFTVPAHLDNVAAVTQALRAFIASHVPEEDCNAIELGVVEALTNIVRHGYADAQQGPMDVGFEQSVAAAIVEITDCGKPIPDAALGGAGSGSFDFDPAQLDDLPEGGMGLSIIKTVFDAVHYESEGGVNRLVLGRRFGSAQEAAGVPGD